MLSNISHALHRRGKVNDSVKTAGVCRAVHMHLVGRQHAQQLALTGNTVAEPFCRCCSYNSQCFCHHCYGQSGSTSVHPEVKMA